MIFHWSSILILLNQNTYILLFCEMSFAQFSINFESSYLLMCWRYLYVYAINGKISSDFVHSGFHNVFF